MSAYLLIARELDANTTHPSCFALALTLAFSITVSFALKNKEAVNNLLLVKKKSDRTINYTNKRQL